jgi:hypothetical protein
MGNLSIKKLRYALEAAGQGASGSPRLRCPELLGLEIH